MQVNDQLQPAEGALDDAAVLIQPMKPKLDELKNVAQDTRNLAQVAQDSADDAADEADSVKQVILSSGTGNGSRHQMYEQDVCNYTNKCFLIKAC